MLAGGRHGYFLAREGGHFTVLEAADSIGSAWRSRWDSLVLFTPRRYHSLPGLPFPGDPDGYPGREEAIDYLGSYASTFELPVQLNSAVHSVAAVDDGFVLDLGRDSRTRLWSRPGRFRYRSVPPFAADLT